MSIIEYEACQTDSLCTSGNIHVLELRSSLILVQVHENEEKVLSASPPLLVSKIQNLLVVHTLNQKWKHQKESEAYHIVPAPSVWK